MKSMYTALLLLLAGSVWATQVTFYDAQVQVITARQSIRVTMSVSLNHRSGDTDTLRFLLNKNAQMGQIAVDKQPVGFLFDSSGRSPNRYLPDARTLIITTASLSPGSHQLTLAYDCYLGNMSKAGCAFTSEYIELNTYGTWFPINYEYGSFTCRVAVRLDPAYGFSGSGVVSGGTGNWQLTQTKPQQDIVLIASPILKTKTYRQGQGVIRVDYVDLSDTKADSILANCQAVYGYFEQLFGGIDGANLTFFINPTRRQTSYARQGFISFQIKGQSIAEINRGIGHEIGHFWWNKAGSDTWEDWLNESFAEYSSLLYLRREQGPQAFDREIATFRKVAEPLPPLRGMSRSYDQASTVLYRKGPVILYDLEKQIGTDAFLALLNATVAQKVSRTTDFLKLIEQRFSPDVRQSVEAWLDR